MRICRLSAWVFPMILSLALACAPPCAVASGDLAGKEATAADRTQTIETRVSAILELGASRDTGAAGTLLRLLNDASEEDRVRVGAVLALADLGTPRGQIVDAFETAYRKPHAKKNLRYTILLSLGKLKATESLPLMTDALASRDSMTRLKAVQAMGALQDDDVLVRLASHLEKEEDHLVRAAAVRAVGRSRTATAERILAKALRSDPAPLVRNNAAMMLGEFTTLSPDSLAALRAARDDSSFTVRATARRIVP